MPAGGEIPAGDLGSLVREETGLHLTCYLELALHASFFDRDLVQTRVFNGNSCAGGDGVEQFEISFGEDTRLQSIVHVDQPQSHPFELQRYTHDRA